MPPQYGELQTTSGSDRFTSLGHPCKFRQLSRLGSVTARQSSTERQPNFTALNRGRHLRSAGRPSRWALAHISSFCFWRSKCTASSIQKAGATRTLRLRLIRLVVGHSTSVVRRWTTRYRDWKWTAVMYLSVTGGRTMNGRVFSSVESEWRVSLDRCHCRLCVIRGIYNHCNSTCISSSDFQSTVDELRRYPINFTVNLEDWSNSQKYDWH